jgi:hypothetical protein
MSGGSKGQTAPSTSEPVVGTQPAYLQGTTPTMQPAGMPGQIAALAQQLSAGFGSTPAAFMADLNKTYKPAKTLDFTKAGTPAPKPKTTPNPNSSGGQVLVNGQWQQVNPNGQVFVNGKWQQVTPTAKG